MESKSRRKDEELKKQIAPSISIVKLFDSWKEFQITSTYETINGLRIKIKKVNREFKFEAGELNTATEMQKHQGIGYGFFKEFSINNEETQIYLPWGVEQLKMSLGENMIIQGSIWHIESKLDKEDRRFHRLIIPIRYSPENQLHRFIESSSFRVGKSWRPRGLIRIQLSGTNFDFFNYSIEDQDFIFVDCLDLITYSEFEIFIGSIIYTFGFISGNLFRNELFILQSISQSFEEVCGYQFRRIEDNIESNMSIVPFKVMEGLDIKERHKTGKLSESTFCSIVSKAHDHPGLLRTIKIISQSNILPLELRTAAYSVALETIRNVVIEANQDKANPFKEKQFARKIVKQIRKIIDPISEGKFNNKETIIKRVQNLNQVGNTESFKKAFELLEMELTVNDEFCISKRNDFLHGRIPFMDEEEGQKNDELKHIADKLHFLVSCLIFKYAGFSGYVLNKSKLYSALKSKKKIEEPLIRKI